MKNILTKISTIVLVLLITLLFSCQEDVRELRDSDPWIVYVSDSNGAIGIYAINPLTKEKLFIYELDSDQVLIKYDPQQDRIIFPHQVNNQKGMLTDGRDNLFLSPNLQIPPSWSVNGKIVYGKETESSGDLFVSDAEGKNERQLTNDSAIERNPIWNPSGEKIVYVKEVENGWDLFIIDVATREVSRLTELENYISNPSWSPDGERIAFERIYDNQKEICVFSFSTGGITRITNRPGDDIIPSWAPDSFTIVFSGNENNKGNWDIWTIDIETRESNRWTEQSGFDGGPVFVPYSSIKELIN